MIQFHLGVPGLSGFDTAEKSAVRLNVEEGVAIPCLSGRDLLAAKTATGRPQDQTDILFLRELQRLGKLSG